MFVALAPLVQKQGKLTVTIFPGHNGRMKVCVAPSTEKGKGVVLSTPLTLTATPDELDQGFAAAITTFQASLSSLEAQIEATTTVLNEAQKSQSSKAVKALDKASKAASPSTPAATADTSDGDEEREENGDSGHNGEAIAAAQATPAVPAAAGTNLFDLI